VRINQQLQQRFGQRVKQLREEKGYTQERFALECELDRTYVSGIERGVRNPTLQILSTLSAGLGVSIASLLRGVDAEQSA
jgi:transcriptional regulator with XRE-family HTH domain